MKEEIIQIGGRNCHIYRADNSKYLLIQPFDDHDLEVLDNEVAVIKTMTDKPFSLVAFEVLDWQKELTPWPSPPVFGKIPFGDGAKSTLSLVENELIPILQEASIYDTNTIKCLLGGYSLAGLFCLWACYQTPLFNGIAAVSPSVWYPNWLKYAENKNPLASYVYLSLGDKEEKTKNLVMAQVSDCIRKQHKLLEAQSFNTILEWNKGNHFQHPDERTAKGFAWLMNQIQ